MWEKIKAFYKENLQQKVREGLKEAVKAFINVFWNYIKEDAILSARKSLKLIMAIAYSPEGEAKKEAIVDLIMLKIKLPLVAKPFKGLIRKMISNKLDEILQRLFGKGLELVG